MMSNILSALLRDPFLWVAALTFFIIGFLQKPLYVALPFFFIFSIGAGISFYEAKVRVGNEDDFLVDYPFVLGFYGFIALYSFKLSRLVKSWIATRAPPQSKSPN